MRRLAVGARLGAGRTHFCGITSTRDLLCWGNNNFGQIGDGTTGTATTPTQVIGIGKVNHVVGGRFETCAVELDGNASCWGEGTSGQLGNGANASSPLPVAVSAVAGIITVAASSVHACALTINGVVHCWGDGTDGRLGTGNEMSSNVARLVPSLPLIASLSSGGSTSCAVARASGELWCWGFNQNGEVGDGTMNLTLSPVRNLLPAVRAVSNRDNEPLHELRPRQVLGAEELEGHLAIELAVAGDIQDSEPTLTELAEHLVAPDA